jgi:hypothetical protein
VHLREAEKAMTESTAVAGSASAEEGNVSERTLSHISRYPQLAASDSYIAGLPDDRMQTADLGFQAEHANDAILRNIRSRMADHADLLRYLPVDSVRIEHLSESQPRKTHPYRIHFGTLQGAGSTEDQVGVLLSRRDKEGSLKLKYMVSTIYGDDKGYVSVADAIKLAKPARAFGGIVEADGIDWMKLRAVVRYYFIANKIDLPSTWSLDGMFIKELILACKVAESNAGRHAGPHRQTGFATEQLSQMSVQPHGSLPGVQENFPDRSKNTYEARWMDSISGDGGRRSRHSRQSVNGQVYKEHNAGTEAFIDHDKENVQQSGFAKQHANTLRDTTSVRPPTFAHHQTAGLAQDHHVLADASRTTYTSRGLPVLGNPMSFLTPQLSNHSVTLAEAFHCP